MRASILAALLIAAGVVPSAAQDAFRSPSGNIACAYYEGYLRCDLREISNRPPTRPADCDLDWGQAFAMEATSRRAERICHGDTVFDAGLPVLRYGDGWSRGGFTCLSSAKGISCRNARGAGWDLARARQTLQ